MNATGPSIPRQGQMKNIRGTHRRSIKKALATALLREVLLHLLVTRVGRRIDVLPLYFGQHQLFGLGSRGSRSCRRRWIVGLGTPRHEADDGSQDD